MPRWVVVCVLAALAVLPARAAAADCASPGVPGQFDVFVGANLTANTGGATIQGRVAAGATRGSRGSPWAPTRRSRPTPTAPTSWWAAT